MNDPRAFLTRLFDAAIAAADPARILLGNLPTPSAGRTIVIGAGKGVAQLAAAFEDAWQAAGHGPVEGVVVTRVGYAVPCRHIRVVEASHPVPDAAGLAGAEALLQAARAAGPDDLVVALITGGGSALLPAPPEGFTLEDEAALNRALLASGAPISAMNRIRKCFSRIKGGRLGAAVAPARLVTLIVSDVPGDAPHEVASGPTVPDAAGADAALADIAAWNIALPQKLHDHIAACRPPLPTDPEFAGHRVRVIASARLSLEAAAEAARSAGVTPVILSDRIEGEAREVAKVLGAIAIEAATQGQPFAPPVVLLSGGETTVTLGSASGQEQGRGGRNTEFLLSLAITCAGLQGFTALAADTDGIDGSEDNAGAYADATTCARLAEAGLDPGALLARHDAWTAFVALGDLFVPGPTGTNVNDFRAILLNPPAKGL